MKKYAIAATLWGLWPCIAAAAEEGGHASEAANPMTVDIWHALFTILVFVILVLVLSRTAFKPILTTMRKREEFIRDSLAHAKQDRADAEARLKEYEQKLEKAGQEASTILEEARRDAEVQRRRVEGDARHKSEEILARAKREIGIARDAALKSLYEESVELASSLAVSALKRQMSPEEHQRLVLDSLRELGQMSEKPE